MSDQQAPGQPAAVRAATQALARDLNLAEGSISVVSAEATEWSDASLGCAEPGKAYIQVITPGFRVVLAAGGKNYEYHTDLRERAIRCPK